MRMDAQAYAERNVSGGAGMRRVTPNAPVHVWAVPTPKLNAPLRKEVEREMGAPEGNLAIVERCAHERQRLFSCREYGWVGSAHVLTNTQDGAVEHQTQMQSKNGKNLNVKKLASALKQKFAKSY